MRIGGIDLGGTKIEARLFDRDWQEIARHRIATPTASYAALLDGLAAQVGWLESHGELGPVGLGTPGLVHPETGIMLTANLPATGHPLGADLSARTGRPVAVINDCRAFALSEARMGAGQGYPNMLGLIIGTGLAGGQVVRGQLVPDANGQHGEYGHLPLPADLVATHDLPLVPCGCGLTGCFETFLTGPGLIRLARLKAGVDRTAPEIMDDPALSHVRDIWFDLAAGLVAQLARSVDPQIIVLGGGLGARPGLPDQIAAALPGKLLSGTARPLLVQARHGDASGALGAALHAREEMT